MTRPDLELGTRVEQVERLVARAARARDAFARNVLLIEARLQAEDAGPIAAHLVHAIDALEREAEVRP